MAEQNKQDDQDEIGIVVDLVLATEGHKFDMEDLVDALARTVQGTRIRAQLDGTRLTEWVEVTYVEPVALMGDELYGLSAMDARKLMLFAVEALDKDEWPPGLDNLAAKVRKLAGEIGDDTYV